MKTPKKGQRVWGYHLTTEKSRLGGAHALKPVPRFVVREREFTGVVHPTWAKGEERWACKPVGRTDDFGTGYKPADVYESPEAARKALAKQLGEMIGKLEALRALVIAGAMAGDLEGGAQRIANPVLHSDNLPKAQGGAK